MKLSKKNNVFIIDIYYVHLR